MAPSDDCGAAWSIGDGDREVSCDEQLAAALEEGWQAFRSGEGDARIFLDIGDGAAAVDYRLMEAILGATPPPTPPVQDLACRTASASSVGSGAPPRREAGGGLPATPPSASHAARHSRRALGGLLPGMLAPGCSGYEGRVRRPLRRSDASAAGASGPGAVQWGHGQDAVGGSCLAPYAAEVSELLEESYAKFRGGQGLKGILISASNGADYLVSFEAMHQFRVATRRVRLVYRHAVGRGWRGAASLAAPRCAPSASLPARASAGAATTPPRQVPEAATPAAAPSSAPPGGGLKQGGGCPKAPGCSDIGMLIGLLTSLAMRGQRA